MATTVMRIQVSQTDLVFRPGGAPVNFTLTVVNTSRQFASFQVEVQAAGQTPGHVPHAWYQLTPEISTKKPPGDITTFGVRLIHNPVPGFTGVMNLTVRVFSIELRAEERQVVRLFVQESMVLGQLRLELPVPQLRAYPGQRLEVPVRVTNLGLNPLSGRLTISGVPPDWWVGGAERWVHPEGGAILETEFRCQLPGIEQALSQAHPLTVTLVHPDVTPLEATGVLEVLVSGFVQLTSHPAVAAFPPKRVWFPGKKPPPAEYTLTTTNTSNLYQDLALVVSSPPGVTGEGLPEHLSLRPGEQQQLHLLVRAQRPWVGWPSTRTLQVSATLAEPSVKIQTAEHSLTLRVKPLLPIWLQLVLLLLLALSGFLGLRQPVYHTGPVNAVTLDGLGESALSGADDQTVRRWQVVGNRLHPLGVVATTNRAVRTLALRPADEDLLATGLENGWIQIWDLLSDSATPFAAFSPQEDDRILALAYTNSSRYLFSGHGSGLVRQWNANPESRPTASQNLTTNLVRHQFDFAVYGLAVVGTSEQTLAVVGRYNQIQLWPWSDPNPKAIQRLPYRVGGQDDYITSVSVPRRRANLMVTGTTQGSITLWNLEPCLQKQNSCEIMDQWLDGHGGLPVRSVAFSPSACYLVSGGDDGRVMLWPLQANGQRSGDWFQGKAVANLRSKVNSVGITPYHQELRILSGADDHQVRLHTLPKPEPCSLQ
ncbi:Putative NTPase (NACHT family) [Gloeomargarita lithophora Alchichica-D10]|uniref:NTPase (NACHT family) n=1 Tax=Gloeomargarita lithophora Alchichica-D10 TaxID=1188229 RepID=A0A1J0AE62_9CYAN|nr:hypothetical protein [Gloeomargarita lithophora]APB34208.1 Putative NTPase (NACHT family) [Gloeomargarita lithophora Alchichica-D10]